MRESDRKKLFGEKGRLLREQEIAALNEGSLEKRNRIFMRRKYLSELAVRSLHAFPAPTVFISYETRSGTPHKDMAVKMFQEHGFEVKTGFDSEVNRADDTLQAIKSHIRASATFLGILTPNLSYELRSSASGEPRHVPSPWVLEEKGIAEAYELPIRLLVDQRVHEDFYLRVKAGKLLNVFSETNFEQTLRSAVDALVRRYHERFLLDGLV
jgi:hypothetical protein